MTMPKAAPTTCDSEPIHTPGSIQPFGVLLVFDPNTLTLRHASQNSRDALGLGAADPLGSTVAALLGVAAENVLRDALPKDGLIDHRTIPVVVAGAIEKRWHAGAHCQGGMLFVELEQADAEATTPMGDMLSAVRVSAGRLCASTTISNFCAVAAREIRSLTGYDRVMVYRFDDEWNGEVIAEERREDMEPYLGLHYPASDIPAQARAMFLVNRVRVIPDSAYEPIPVVPNRDSRTESPLDMSRCVLRSVAPVHCEYLHNMGVGASLTASLIVGGRLWGLIACHHTKPRRPGPSEREACDLFSQVASAHLAFVAEMESRRYLATLSDALTSMGTRIGSTAPPIAGLVKDTTNFLALAGAGGAVLWRSGYGILVGRTPPAEALSGLIDWIKAAAVPVIATDRLAQLYAPAMPFADVASGLLAVEVSQNADEYILWFRPEVLQTVNWGGDPNGKVATDGRISPRRSFAVWKENVRNRSLPWRPVEVENAKKVAEMVRSAASMSALRLEGLLPICAWCKKVRDEPGYWRAVEDFMHDMVDVRFTHGVCPECLNKQMAEFRLQSANDRSA